MAKQKMIKTLENMVVNGGIVRPAMIKAGYKKSYAENPQKLERTKAWPELVKKYFPDTKLAKKHSELLEAESETVQLGALKLGYEITNKIAQPLPQLQEITINTFFTNPKIQAATKTYAEALKEQIYEAKKSAHTLQDEQELGHTGK